MTVRTSVDLNADVGEGCGQDGALMPLVSSANIACGLHAGDESTMREAVQLARDHGVAIGAHPSFPDRDHFGRRELTLSATDLHECIVAQLRSLAEVAAAAGTVLRHVKPHGALYTLAARDQSLAEVVVAAIRSIDPSLLIFGLAGSVLVKTASRMGLRPVGEAFADRAYRPDGSLVPRDQAGSILQDASVVGSRAVAMVREQRVVAVDGSRVRVDAATLCIHGDTPGAAALAQRVRAALAAAGITVAAP